MNRPITSHQARAYVERWEAVRAIQVAELRAMAAEEKFRQLAALMAAARALGAEERDDPDVYLHNPWSVLRGMHLG